MSASGTWASLAQTLYGNAAAASVLETELSAAGFSLSDAAILEEDLPTTLSSNSTQHHYYAYNEAGQLLGEYDETGAAQVEYIWFNGQPLAQVRDSGIYTYHNDHLGTPRVLTDESGATVWAATYTPFGEASIATEVVENNLRFPGQYFDGETNLHYNWFRYYDPSLGRYLRPDPLGLYDGPNPYTYVHNNPVRYSDPTGLVTWKCTRFSTGISIGIVGFNRVTYTCTSECVNGEKTTVRVVATGSGPSLGGEFEVTGSHNNTFTDNNSSPNPDVFNGSYFEASGGFTGGIGYGTGSASINNGSVTGDLSGYSAGAGFGGSEFFGNSEVIWSRTSKCDDGDQCEK